MGLPAGASYYACDVFCRPGGVSQPLLSLLSVDGRAEVCDLVHAGLPGRGCGVAAQDAAQSEQMDRQAGRRLLDALDAPLLIISYPAHSLGGRRKGMPDHYAARFGR